MTSPTQRRHDELRDLLARNLEAFKHEAETPMRGHGECCEPGRTPDVEWDCASCGEAEPTWQHECTDVTEEPPIGSQVRDRGGHVWQRFEGGWSQRTLARLNPVYRVSWGDVYQWGPLRLTTDADRERVGLPVEADDPRPDSCCGKCPPIVGGGYDCTCEGNPRCAPDVDPDEALARVLNSEVVRQENAGDVTVTALEDSLAFERNLARAAREHIEAEWEEVAKSFEDGRDKWQAEARRQRARAEKAETERDTLRERREALRADVDEFQYKHRAYAGTWELVDALARDDERGRA